MDTGALTSVRNLRSYPRQGGRGRGPRPEKLALVQRRFPAVTTTADYLELLPDPSIDAIAVATPVNTHFELGLAVLRAGKHCGSKSR